MAVFEAVTFKWKERIYTIPPDQVMRAIAKIEDVLTLSELHRYGLSGTAPIAKLAMAFGAVLRHAGAAVQDDEVYAALFNAGEQQEQVMAAIQTLLAMMVPPEHLQQRQKEDAAETGKSLRVVAPLSRKRTR